jgi:HEAT repeat protein
LRKTASYVLGALEDTKAVEALEPLLSDADKDVRWNAALSLAKLRSDAGYSVLMQMLDREALVQEYALPEEKIEEIMVNATRGIALLRNPESLTKLSQISSTDKSLKVRQAAIEALEYQKNKVV